MIYLSQRFWTVLLLVHRNYLDAAGFASHSLLALSHHIKWKITYVLTSVNWVPQMKIFHKYLSQESQAYAALVYQASQSWLMICKYQLPWRRCVCYYSDYAAWLHVVMCPWRRIYHMNWKRSTRFLIFSLISSHSCNTQAVKIFTVHIVLKVNIFY